MKERKNAVWITQHRMAELFNTTGQNISRNTNNIWSEGKSHRATVKKYLTVKNILKEEIHIRENIRRCT